MNHKFLVIGPSTDKDRFLTADVRALVSRAGDVEFLDLLSLDELQREKSFDRAIASTHALICMPWGRQGLPAFSDDRWSRARNLKVIAGTFDHRFAPAFDVADAHRRGVAVIDTSGSMSLTVAEFALAMILNLLRDIPDTVADIRRGEWPHHWQDLPGFVFGDLTRRRIGLAGFGAIGKRLAELLVPFRCEVSAYDPFVSREVMTGFGVRRAESMKSLAAASDILVVGIPKTPATENVVNREVVDALPRGSLFVLVGRMWVVEQEALWRRTAAGEIRAAIDVFLPEPPPPNSEFLSNRNVLPTPHIAGNTEQANRRCFKLACTEAIAALEKKPFEYAVTVEHVAIYSGQPGSAVGAPE